MLSIKGLKIESALGKAEKKSPVKDVTLTLDANEIAVITGRSGAGKSLTALSILGLIKGSLKMTGGEITYLDETLNFSVTAGGAECICNGKKITGADAYREIRGKRISMVFQEHVTALNPLFTVGEHISDTLLTHKRCAKSEVEKVSLQWLEKVHIWSDNDERLEILKKYPCHLAGGQAQRLMIALALCTEPRILIADEPTTNLDASLQNSTIDLILKLLENKLSSLLLITHDIRIVRRILNTHRLTIYFFHDGKSVAKKSIKSVSDLYSAWSDNDAKDFFSVALDKIPAEENETHVESVSDLDSAWSDKKNATSDGDIVLKIDKVRRYFKKKNGFFPNRQLENRQPIVKAVDGVSLIFKKGETIGLIGESGSGKTTLGRLILRLCVPQEGRILYRDQDILTLDEKEIRRKIQMVFQSPDAFLNRMMRVDEIMKEAVRLNNKNLSKDKVNDKIKELFDMVGLPKEEEFLSRYPFNLSGGERRRLGIARVLAQNPEIIVFDEPIAEIDVYDQKKILEQLQRLKQQNSLTYLVISHDLDMIKEICDRIAVMYRGKIIEFGSKDDLIENPMHPYTKKLFRGEPIKIENRFSEEPCVFLNRCDSNRHIDKCKTEEPPALNADDLTNHQCTCHNPLKA
jgi:ABC-type glutathione transport system ATPase component